MQLFYFGLMLLAAYLLGSVPASVWIGKKFYNIDIREHGSGNPGATNTIRVLGWKAGLPVLLFDILKGWIAVKSIILSDFDLPGSDDYVIFQLMLGAAALIGHIFPVFAGFRGGKGVATLFGIVLAIDPFSTLICISIFIVTLLISRYVSLSSMIAGLSFPFVKIFIIRTDTISLVIFSIAVAGLLLITHQKNIKRLIRGEESKADFLRIRRQK
ncbi:MAG: glycerol-3-phosphate 1-O-acyltransferase PlsY [Bacteroidales bacterium]|nr:MAG: glycerol-3-phosphate 1-O-acyltransferase PlsY [Bacteroidales bacterium]